MQTTQTAKNNPPLGLEVYLGLKMLELGFCHCERIIKIFFCFKQRNTVQH